MFYFMMLAPSSMDYYVFQMRCTVRIHPSLKVETTSTTKRKRTIDRSVMTWVFRLIKPIWWTWNQCMLQNIQRMYGRRLRPGSRYHLFWHQWKEHP